MAGKHWKTISKSQFPWEQEALDFVHEGFPAQDNYLAWSNFEFIADDGSINEVDLLVACPQGVFLIEIKSRPGIVRGDAINWTWDTEGRKRTEENPLILANRKCKRLKSLLARQRAFRRGQFPFVEPLVFLSHSEVDLRLPEAARSGVCLRDRDETNEIPARAGILAAIRRRECSGLRQLSLPVVIKPTVQAFARSMEQAGIRPRQIDRKAGDFILDDLIFESPTGAYQDWLAHHVSHTSTKRLARIYQVAIQATPEEREILRTAARREFEVLESLEHPGVLRADSPTECEHGPVLFLKTDEAVQRLDQFLLTHGDELPVDKRLSMMRQIADTIRYAHSRRIVHRSLSPQSIFVCQDDAGDLTLQIGNWQTSARISGTTTSQGTRISATVHAAQLVEDASLAYLAPETLTGGADGGEELDSFTLGTLAYLIFSGKPPASSQAELQEKLRASGGGLSIKEVLDGAVEALADLVQYSANGDVTLRYSADEFLEKLDEVEEQLTRPDCEVVHPHEATIGSMLEGGFQVVRTLGKGATAVAFLVERQKRQCVLKVARSPESNARIKREFKLLKSLAWPQLIEVHDLHEFNDLLGISMDYAGDQTLARQIRDDGALDLTLLKQFGEDLLRTVSYLDEQGVAHRDIKPDNIGVRIDKGKKRKELCLFDFSLADAPAENITVGTPPYLDPFLCERKIKRWDTKSELFSVAMTMHEMATGSLPKWGDGRALPSLTQGEVKLVGELFPSELRGRFVDFFAKALCRDYAARFDNLEEMLSEWLSIFETIDEPARTGFQVDAGETAVFQLPDNLTLETQLVLFGLSTRLSNALDRLDLNTVGEFLKFPHRRIYKLRGVGNKTRRELGALYKQLRDVFPAGGDADAAKPDTDDQDEGGDGENVDSLARYAAALKRGGRLTDEQRMLQLYLGWQAAPDAQVAEWPSQTELAAQVNVTRQRIGQVVTKARKHFARFPPFDRLRDDIDRLLDGLGGVAGHRELIGAVLAARGSTREEPESMRMASVAVRAALETEKGSKEPRFDEYRSGGKIFIARHPDLKSYMQRLGQIADRLADENPLPAPSRVLEQLRGVARPAMPMESAPPSDNRMLQLAVLASESAVLSAKLEIYPRGLSAQRALALAQNALVCPLGAFLKVEEIQKRASARYPQAEKLPGRPELDGLLESLGIDLKWRAQLANGDGAYQPDAQSLLTNQTSRSLPSRLSTIQTLQPDVEVSPDVADARSLEEKLRYSAREGAFLVLSVEPQWMNRALEELRRFSVSVCDLDSVFLKSLRGAAEKKKARWEVVLKADGAARDSTDWRNLERLVESVMPEVEAELRSGEQTRLLVNPGLLARYDRLNLLATLAVDVGRRDGIHGLWVLVPVNGTSPLPILNDKPIPLINPAQHARLTEAWITNRHRAGDEERQNI
jgi:serine/threonine protein kinase